MSKGLVYAMKDHFSYKNHWLVPRKENIVSKVGFPLVIFEFLLPPEHELVEYVTLSSRAYGT